jgi:hypothetical protein
MESDMTEHFGFTGTQQGWTHKQAERASDRFRMLRHQGFEWMHNGDCIGGSLCLQPPSKTSKRAFLRADVIEAPKPYLERNGNIAMRGSVLVATPAEMSEQLRSGTWSTIRRARKLGRTVYIIWPDGSETIEVNQ